MPIIYIVGSVCGLGIINYLASFIITVMILIIIVVVVRMVCFGD